jgi:hypothetical protein
MSALEDPRGRTAADAALLALIALSAVTAGVGAHGAPRLLPLLAAASLVPGGAAITLLPVRDPLVALALAIGLSLAIEAAGTLAMIWTGYWHPAGWAILLACAAGVLLAVDLRRTAGERPEAA